MDRRRKCLRHEDNSRSSNESSLHLGSSSRGSSLNLGTSSPDISRMMTPTLSDDKTDTLSTDISLDFSCSEMSKFETDSMLHAAFNPDRDIDRSPDPSCLQLQSPLDLSITTSFENSLSDCGVSCFDTESGVKNSYSFSSAVNSTESDTFVHLDEVLTVDTLSQRKPEIAKTISTASSSALVTHPPVILGSLGAANFVTAVLNKNVSAAPVPILNNVILPSTSLSLTAPGILVLNPCNLSGGLVNLVTSSGQPGTLGTDVDATKDNMESTPASTVINMCPRPIQSIISLLTSKHPHLKNSSVFTAAVNSDASAKMPVNETQAQISETFPKSVKTPLNAGVFNMDPASSNTELFSENDSAGLKIDEKSEISTNLKTAPCSEEQPEITSNDQDVSPAKKSRLSAYGASIDVSDVPDQAISAGANNDELLVIFSSNNNGCDEVDGYPVPLDIIQTASSGTCVENSDKINDDLDLSSREATVTQIEDGTVSKSVHHPDISVQSTEKLTIKDSTGDKINKEAISDTEIIKEQDTERLDNQTISSDTTRTTDKEREATLTIDSSLPISQSDDASTVTSASTSLPKKRRKYGTRQKKPETLKCDLCSATFSKAGNYYRHRKIHTIPTEDEDFRHTCCHCGRKFLQKCDMKRHMLIHMKEEPFRCHFCGKGYIRQSDLKVHIRFHTRERSHACDLCDKKFFQSGDLNRHKRHVHNEINGLVCGHCKKSYAKETTLIRHMQSNHREIILRSLNDKMKSNTVNAKTGEKT